MNKIIFEIGQVVIAKNNKPLEGNTIAPELVIDQEYPILGIITDEKGNQHLDIGIKSMYNYITSWETSEELPDGDKIHWCHPSRFELKTI